MKNIDANNRLEICKLQNSVSDTDQRTAPQHLLYDSEELMKRISGLDLPPVGPSFITRVCGFDFDNHGFRFGQARRARSPQIAQALGALAVASGFRVTNAA